jgi:hypothetical protein
MKALIGSLNRIAHMFAKPAVTQFCPATAGADYTL